MAASFEETKKWVDRIVKDKNPQAALLELFPNHVGVPKLYEGINQHIQGLKLSQDEWEKLASVFPKRALQENKLKEKLTPNQREHFGLAATEADAATMIYLKPHFELSMDELNELEKLTGEEISEGADFVLLHTNDPERIEKAKIYIGLENIEHIPEPVAAMTIVSVARPEHKEHLHKAKQTMERARKLLDPKHSEKEKSSKFGYVSKHTRSPFHDQQKVLPEHEKEFEQLRKDYDQHIANHDKAYEKYKKDDKTFSAVREKLIKLRGKNVEFKPKEEVEAALTPAPAPEAKGDVKKAQDLYRKSEEARFAGDWAEQQKLVGQLNKLLEQKPYLQQYLGHAYVEGAMQHPDIEQLKESFDRFIQEEMQEKGEHDVENLELLKEAFNKFLDEEGREEGEESEEGAEAAMAGRTSELREQFKQQSKPAQPPPKRPAGLESVPKRTQKYAEMAAEPAEGTGEADQDYDHEMFDKICGEIKKAGYECKHSEFDKYQGVYIDVSKDGDRVARYWATDYFVSGEPEKNPNEKWRSAVLIDPEGDQFSANQGDYFQMDDDEEFEGMELKLVDMNGKETVIENPKKKDLPDLLEVRNHIKYKGKPDEHLVLHREDTSEDQEVMVTLYADGDLDVSDLIEDLKQVG